MNTNEFIEECVFIEDAEGLKGLGLKDMEIEEIRESLGKEIDSYRYFDKYGDSVVSNGLSTFNETRVERVLEHGKYGFAIVSTSRSQLLTDGMPNTDLTDEFDAFKKRHNMNGKGKNDKYFSTYIKMRNYRKDEELKTFLRSSKNPFSFTPSFGGYGNEKDRSFIIYNSPKYGNETVDVDTPSEDEVKVIARKALKVKSLDELELSATMKDLVLLSLVVCNIYNQESVYIQMPDDVPNYYDYRGNKVGMGMNKAEDFIIKDMEQEYYTQTNRDRTSIKNGENRFSADIRFPEKMHLRDVPGSVNGKLMRDYWGYFIP